jgi:hypothetical protein
MLPQEESIMELTLWRRSTSSTTVCGAVRCGALVGRPPGPARRRRAAPRAGRSMTGLAAARMPRE